MSTPITVVLADDQAILRRGLAALLGSEPDLEVIGQAETCAATVQVVRDTRPDVLLVDVQMPAGATSEPGASEVRDGIEVVAAVRALDPAPHCIVLTTFGRPGYLRRTLEAGASGFLVKDAPLEELVDAIRRVHQGLRVVDPQLAAQSLAIGPNPLTEREAAVLRAAATGASGAEIAARLFLGEGTVRNHISSAIGKLGVTNRVEAVRAATDSGWL